MHTPSHQNGFSLVETIIALGVLTVGVLGAAGILTTGMQKLTSSPADVIIMQKATQAIEAVFSARDSHRFINVLCTSACEWAQIRNVVGSGSDGGIFVDGPQPLYTPGPDGLVNTTDDDATIESVILPGHDQLLGTADDQTVVLTQYTREIKIRDVVGENGQLRKVTVTITWGDPGGLLPFQNGPTKRTYTLVTFISSYG
jgi:prepilin-type N-terminal cleavage/methylation domain-containing protein